MARRKRRREAKEDYDRYGSCDGDGDDDGVAYAAAYAVSSDSSDTDDSCIYTYMDDKRIGTEDTQQPLNGMTASSTDILRPFANKFLLVASRGPRGHALAKCGNTVSSSDLTQVRSAY